ncbi:MAG: PIN domain-containing protein [Microthrixaceae bacterium]
MAFGATYDACVLYPACLRDFLVRLGGRRLFQARWTEQILDEMTNAVLRNRDDITAKQLERTRTLMCNAVPDCLTTGYEGLIEGLELPDPNDRHVLAAAIRAGSGVIVTENMKDFPISALQPYNIEPQTPDTFVRHLLDIAEADVRAVIWQQAADLKNPPMTEDDVLARLATQGLPLSVAILRDS